MSKIWLITKREFISRVRKPSFIIMSILGPVIFAAFFAAIFYSASVEDTEERKIAVIDSTGMFIKKIPDTKYLKFEYILNFKVNDLKRILKKTDYYGILYISPIISYSSRGVQFYSYHQPSWNITQHIETALAKELRDQKLMAFHIKNIDSILKSVETSVEVETIKISESGEEKGSDQKTKMWVAYFSSLLIFMFIFSFGMRVMRGIIEEKTNRIVELIVSSVKPFQLMMGKVLGVALTALTQFAIWIVLTTVFIGLVETAFMPDAFPVSVVGQPHSIMETSRHTIQAQSQTPQAVPISPELSDAFAILDSIDFYVVIGMFIFYFIGGYLLYASLFAAVGATIDVDSDNQQFTVPVILPLIFGIVVMLNAMQNPDSPVAYWFSLIPFTSPIVMMARIPYGVPFTDIAISMILLILTFIGTIWLAGKIYRTGILMYGKKVSLREMLKWLRYKN